MSAKPSSEIFDAVSRIAQAELRAGRGDQSSNLASRIVDELPRKELEEIVSFWLESVGTGDRSRPSPSSKGRL
jgi:hypothetical protein